MAALSQCRRLPKKGRNQYTLRNPIFEKVTAALISVSVLKK